MILKMRCNFSKVAATPSDTADPNFSAHATRTVRDGSGLCTKSQVETWFQTKHQVTYVDKLPPPPKDGCHFVPITEHSLLGTGDIVNF